MAVLQPLILDDLEDLLTVQREGAVAGLGHIFPQETHPFPEQRVLERWKREVADPDIDAHAAISGRSEERACSSPLSSSVRT